ncbi:MAG: sigma-70 family RNA polymerase sigma factor [Verrucomicrobiota bacterium]
MSESPSPAKSNSPDPLQEENPETQSSPLKEEEGQNSATDSAKPEDSGEKAKFNYPATRKTLIQRLQDWDDQASWDEFFRTYSGFVFKVACKAGLSESEANEVVQETFIRVAKNMRKKTFTRDGGSFKAWLMNQTRWRIADQFRSRKQQEVYRGRPKEAYDDRKTATMDTIPDNSNFGFEALWEREWKGSLTQMALSRVKAKVSARQYQIFYCYVVKGWEVEEVRKELGVSSAQVYLAKHRVGRIMRKELEYLNEDEI